MLDQRWRRAAGLNAAIRSVVRSAIAARWSRDSSASSAASRDCSRARASGDHWRDRRDVRRRCSTAAARSCGTSRDPARFETRDEGVAEARRQSSREHARSRARSSIGGDGSYRGAEALHARGVAVVGVPGTIDNDFAGIDWSFGFDTAPTPSATPSARCATPRRATSGRSSSRSWAASAGWLATYAGLACGGDCILVPEVPWRRRGRVGAASQTGVAAAARSTRSSSSPRARGHAFEPRRRARRRTYGHEARSVVLGHVQRGGSPSAFDRILRVAHGRARGRTSLVEGQSGVAVGLRGAHTRHVSARGRLRVRSTCCAQEMLRARGRAGAVGGRSSRPASMPVTTRRPQPAARSPSRVASLRSPGRRPALLASTRRDARRGRRTRTRHPEVTAMSWGLENRLSRIIKPADGRTVMLAVDHGYFLGPTTRPRVHPRVDRAARALRRHAHAHARRAAQRHPQQRRHADRAARLRRQQRARGRPLQRDDRHRHRGVHPPERRRHGAVGLRRRAAPAPDASRTSASSSTRASATASRSSASPPSARTWCATRATSRSPAASSPRWARHIVKTYYCEDFERVTAHVPGAGRHGRRQEAARARGARDDVQRDRSAAPPASTWAATSSSPTRPLGMIKAVNAVVHGNASVDDAFAVYVDEKAATRHHRPGVGRRSTADDSAQDLARRPTTMPDTMRVAVYYNNSDVRVEERPVPGDRAGRDARAHPRGGHLRLRRAGVVPRAQGADRAGPRGRRRRRRGGRGRDATCAVGDRVVVSHHVPCNTCRYCLAGNHTACHTLHTTNFDPGGFAEYVRVPALQTDRGILRCRTR